ncbi:MULTISPECIES: hypothetical protein [unclassified Rathayibacter]|uniref:hypothetical protein n=1 Tax=unclassified Rathayibacter TaxID=2609250 RepID=UPI0011B01251|nr:MULTISPECIES: hypothetical protein [unclassified Rathayibacter]
MGAQLVGRAFHFAAEHDLKANELRLLIWMSLKAMDQDKPPRYFAAREESAYGLGRLVPDEPHPFDANAAEATLDREAAFQRVKIATAGLVKAGAIERTRRGQAGNRAEYVLSYGQPIQPIRGTQSVPLKPVDNSPWGT